MGSVDETAVPVLSLNSLPVGMRFHPSDEEVIDLYLRQKINGNRKDAWVIREIDICKWEPWDLPDLSVIRNKDQDWFFFSPLDRKYSNRNLMNRATVHGYWKATGKDRKIMSGSTLIGMKKTLVFYNGRAPRGKRTNWVMHEYRPTLQELDGTNPGQNPYVVCRLFKKQDASIEVSNCGEVEQTASTPMAANYSPEEVQSNTPLPLLEQTVSTPMAANYSPEQVQSDTSVPLLEQTASTPMAANYSPEEVQSNTPLPLLEQTVSTPMAANYSPEQVQSDTSVPLLEQTASTPMAANYSPEEVQSDTPLPLVEQDSSTLMAANYSPEEVQSDTRLPLLEQTASTPMVANYSPEEVQSDTPLPLVAVSSSQLTEDDKHLTIIPENSEETTSKIITPVDRNSDKYDAYDAQPQIVKLAAEENQPLNLDINSDPKIDLFDDKLSSPVLMDLQQIFDHQASSESDGRSGLQYGIDDTAFSDFIDSLGMDDTAFSDYIDSLNWDPFSNEESGSQPMSLPLFNVKDNGSGSDSDLQVTNMPSMQVPCPEKAIDRNIPLGTAPEFCSNIGISFDHSGDEQKSNVGLFQNQNAEMAFSSDGSMGRVSKAVNGSVGQVYNVANDSEQLGNWNVDAGGDTRIIRRARQVQNEFLDTNIKQGTADRRIRLLKNTHGSSRVVKGGSCAQEDRNLKPIIAVKKASESHAAGEDDALTNHVKEMQKTPESANHSKISRQGSNAGSTMVFKDLEQLRRVPCVSNRTMWSSVFVVSAFVLVSVVVFNLY